MKLRNSSGSEDSFHANPFPRFVYRPSVSFVVGLALYRGVCVVRRKRIRVPGAQSLNKYSAFRFVYVPAAIDAEIKFFLLKTSI